MKTKSSDLREHLFATLEGLLDDENPLDINRAKAVAEVGKVIVESAKVEVEMAKVLVQNKTKNEWGDDELIEKRDIFIVDQTKHFKIKNYGSTIQFFSSTERNYLLYPISHFCWYRSYWWCTLRFAYTINVGC